ncbi:MAG TPA: MASE1 domain-containing protein [Steroidobacteraceae bacterium]|nr:MASE1 domain-containing protein [Steroidobacteraceae bacterium]
MLYALGRLRPLPRPPSPAVATLLLFLAYALTAGAMLLLAEHFFIPHVYVSNFPLPWLADGIAVSLMLVWGVRTWPAAFLGSLLVWGVMHRDPPILVFFDAAGEALSLVVTVWMLRAGNFRRQLNHLSDPLTLLVAALAGRLIAMAADLGGCFAGTAFESLSLPPEYAQLVTVPGRAGPAGTAQLLWALARWQLNAIAGITLMVPALLASPRALWHALRARPLGPVTLAGLSLLWCEGALGLPYTWACWPLLLCALMLVAWAAIGFGVLTAALCTLVFSLTAAAGFCQGLGPLDSADQLGSVAATWGFIGLLCCVSPVLTVILSARRHDDRRLTLVAERYRALFSANPTPAWVAEAGSGAILMANAEARGRYGYTEAEFLQMKMTELSAEQEGAAAPPPPEATVVAAALARHRTRDGTIIDVELVSTALELDGRQVDLVYAVDMSDQQELRRRLLAAADGECWRVSQELHDGLGQVLAGLAIGSDALLQRTQRAGALDEAGAAQLGRLAAQARQADILLHQLTTGVSPLDELQGDLLEALRCLPATLPAAERDLIEVSIQATAPVTLSLERRAHLYRVVQESLANAVKHARADRIRVRAVVDPETVHVSVEDDGVGVASESRTSRGLGLQSMRLRAQAASAELGIHTRPGSGTTVTCCCPQAEPAPAASPAEQTAEPFGPRTVSSPERTGTSLVRELFLAALTVLGCYTSAAIAHTIASAGHSHFTYAEARLTIPNLLAGAAVAALLIGGRRQWPAVLLGFALSRFAFIGEPVPTALLLAGLNTVSCYTVVSLLQRWGFSRSFDRWQDPLVLCLATALGWSVTALLNLVLLPLLAGFGAPAVAPGVARLLAPLAAGGWRVTAAQVAADGRWWFDSTIGIVLVVPTLTLSATLRRAVRDSLPELLMWGICVPGATLLLLTVTHAAVLLPVLTLSILLVVWAAARFGVALASLATLLFAMSATASLSTHSGALATQTAATAVAYVWGFVGVLTVTGLFLAALLAEHERRRRNIVAVNQRYRALFRSDPRPLWLHDARSGAILEANEPAARAYGYTTAEFTTLRVEQLLAPGLSPDVLRSASAVPAGPIAMKHRRKGGDSVDVEVWSFGTFLDGRRVNICFAHDVTERNALRRLLFDRAELERRQLASELRRVLTDPLAALATVGDELQAELSRSAVAGRPLELLESLARRAAQAASSCREVAHRLSPLQANRGDLVAALHTLRSQTPVGSALEITVSGASPLTLAQHQSEHVFSLLSEIITRCPGGTPGNAIRIAITTFGRTLRLAVEAQPHPLAGRPSVSLARHPSVLLRARAMGARLWELPAAGAGTRVVCDYPL